MKKRVGLALGGGGARGFCHIGVVEVLQENNIPIDVVTGCSMGALVGGGVAAGLSVSQMREVAAQIKNMTVFDIEIDLRPSKHDGLARGDRAMRVYKHLVGEKLIEECPVKFAAIATDLTSGTLRVFNEGPIWRAVRASMSIPGVFRPVREDGMVLADGGVLKRIPIEEASALGADIIIAVDAMGAPRKNPELNSVFEIVENAFMIMDWKTSKYESKKGDVLIVPEMGGKTIYNFKNNLEAVEAGREAALKALPEITALLGRKEIKSRNARNT